MAWAKRIAFHRCFAPDCQKDVPNNKLMCFHHWKSIPVWMQDAIVTAWKYGIKNHCHPTAEYLDAIRQAQAHIRTMLQARLAKANVRNMVLGLSS